MSRNPQVQAIVSDLLGTWTGKGAGQYPTIEPFRYREVLTIEERGDHPALGYEQRAWRITPDGEVVSHWETGLLRISSDGKAKVFNAQGGRAEAMDGSWEPQDGGWVIRLRSTGFAGDERVRASTRTIRVDSQTLSYEMAMEATAADQMHPHLEATLTRRG